MRGRPRIKTEPALEPVLPADVRLFGPISSDVTDAMLNPLIKSARKEAEGYQNRAYITQTWELVFDSFPNCPIVIPKPPLISLVSVTITDINGTVTTMNATDFVVDTSFACGEISLKYNKTWPPVTPERAGVVIQYTCGYGAAAANIPENIKTAIILGAAWRYWHPGEPMTKAFEQMLDIDKIQAV